ncbi:transglycosylase domain-containing protein [Actinomadura sp. HBU206391]|uniref:transglycosylase domain-containing protein n=1 Tax=Actinomadura sp. HBU206391 TaxID=2731692 RepID=UPI0016500993|nr:transglycosylase domain-containing protein [Actinomadura sp. HBU206391]MBC6456466.1 penicillin-binding protein [Actinomadura sp. HBU206391]
MCGLGLLGMFTLVGVAYAMTPVPKAGNEDATKQAAIFYYADGKSEIARMGRNRELITIDKVPMHVQEAVIAAENRSFRSDRGFSPTGIARAAWVNVTGGSTQGGSTITQQLAKNYYLTDERSISRKFKELFISVKLGEQKTKPEILQDYLNTIYFGRNAYGIQAASRAFFNGRPVDKLREDEGALLAAIIQQPGRFDPRSADKEARAETLVRYQYVLEGMVKTNALTQAKADQYKKRLPLTSPINKGQTFAGQKGYMIERAKIELGRQGITEKQIIDEGLRITTTFDKRKMEAARVAVEKAVPEAAPNKLPSKHIQLGLVSVNSASGEVVAFYGGHDYLKDQFDNVWQGSAQAGSAMKPYVLATALKDGYSLKTLVEGKSPTTFDGSGNVVPNGTPGGLRIPNSHAGGTVTDLVHATQSSVNTAFVQLALKVGLPEVIKTAEDAGIASDLLKPYKGQAGLALGINDVRPIEQAAGYAPFANGGTYHQPHVIRKVTRTDGSVYRKLSWEKHKVFDQAVAADATHAMRAVVQRGTGTAAALPDRPVAGKTGTTDKNVAAWFVGYVPQVSTAVTMYNDKKKTLFLQGLGEVEGGLVPARIWHAYMAEATKGMSPAQFPPPVFGGTNQKFATPPATPTPTPTPEDDDRDCSRPRDQFKPRCRDQQSPPPTQGPIPGQPCNEFNMPLGCDPNTPPQNPPPDWWCQRHQGDPRCKDPNDGRPNTQTQSRSQTLARIKD